MAYTVMMDFVNDHLTKVLAFVSILSILGCLLIMFTYWAYRDTRTASRHIVVCLSIADFFTASGSLFAALYGKPGTRNVGCTIQSFMSTTSVMSSLLWTVTLSVYLYFYVVKENSDTVERLLFPNMHIVCWGFPLLINLVALWLRKLGANADLVSSGSCWIKFDLSSFTSHEKRDAIFWMFVDGKLWEIITYIVIVIIYIKIKCFVRRKAYFPMSANEIGLIESTVIAARSFGHKLALIPSVLIALRMWGTIRFFILLSVVYSSSATYDETLTDVDKVLLVLQAIGDNLIGAANCVLFCFCSPKILSHWKSSAKKCLEMVPPICQRCKHTEDVPMGERAYLFAASIS